MKLIGWFIWFGLFVLGLALLRAIDLLLWWTFG